MNLQETNQFKQGHGTPEEWRKRHTIRFSQIDGAGIVYYPRYFEMLAESFPQQFTMHQAATLDLTFHQPVRLADQLILEPTGQTNDQQFSVAGSTGDKLCFEIHKTPVQKSKPAPWLNDKSAFVRETSIGEWMCGADSRLHLSRSYELTAVLMEEWFTKALLCPFATLESPDGALVPTARLQTTIYELPQNDDWIKLSLSVLHIGRSSLGMGMSMRRNEQLLLQSQQTVVFVASQNEQLSSVEIPQPVRQRLEQQLFSSSEVSS